MLHYILKERIIQKFKKSRIIVTGDFNFHLPEVGAFLSKIGLLPVFGEGMSTHRDGGALDEVFSNVNVRAKHIVEPPTSLTDHKSLICEFELVIEPYDLDFSRPPTFST